MHAVAYVSGTSYSSRSAVAAKLWMPPNEMEEIKKKAKHIHTAGTFMKPKVAFAAAFFFADSATASPSSRGLSTSRQAINTTITVNASTPAANSAMRQLEMLAMPARNRGATA